MKDGRFKESVESKYFELEDSLPLVIDLYSNAESLSKAKTKEAAATIRELELIGFKNLDLAGQIVYEEAHVTLTNFALHFDHLTLHSLFVTSFAFFDHYLEWVSKILEFSSDSKIKISDIERGNSEIDHKRRYLNLVHELNTAASGNRKWQKILIFHKIRNIISHHQDMFPDKYKNDKEMILKFLEKFKGRKMRDFGFKITDIKFLEEFKNVVMEYAKEMTLEIREIPNS